MPEFDPNDKVHQGLAKKAEAVRHKLNDDEKRELAAELNKAKPNAGILAKFLQR